MQQQPRFESQDGQINQKRVEFCIKSIQLTLSQSLEEKLQFYVENQSIQNLDLLVDEFNKNLINSLQYSELDQTVRCFLLFRLIQLARKKTLTKEKVACEVINFRKYLTEILKQLKTTDLLFGLEIENRSKIDSFYYQKIATKLGLKTYFDNPNWEAPTEISSSGLLIFSLLYVNRELIEAVTENLAKQKDWNPDQHPVHINTNIDRSINFFYAEAITPQRNAISLMNIAIGSHFISAKRFTTQPFKSPANVKLSTQSMNVFVHPNTGYGRVEHRAAEFIPSQPEKMLSQIYVYRALGVAINSFARKTIATQYGKKPNKQDEIISDLYVDWLKISVLKLASATSHILLNNKVLTNRISGIYLPDDFDVNASIFFSSNELDKEAEEILRPWKHHPFFGKLSILQWAWLTVQLKSMFDDAMIERFLLRVQEVIQDSDLGEYNTNVALKIRTISGGKS